MADKKIVDDYYSSVSKASENNSDSSGSKKIKIKAKKKIVVKKKEEPKKNEKIEEKVVDKKEFLEIPKKKPSGMVVVRRASNDNKKVTKFIRKSKEIPYKKLDNNNDTQKPNTIKERGIDKLNKKTFNNNVSESTFSDDKSKSKGKKDFSSKKEGFGSKRSRLSPYSGKRNRGRYIYEEEKVEGFTRSNKVHKKKEEKNVEDIKQDLVDRKGETITVPDILSLKELSEKMGVAFPKLIAEFMKNGMMVNINSKIDFETASIVADAFEIKLEKDLALGMDVEDVLKGNLDKLLAEDDNSKLIKRCPVVSIMGHVDHGKTSLLDYIRKEKVAEGEAGGITQSIGAYQVSRSGEKITFLDTPGHEAFTIMRARGAKSTDIAILVVAADEGVKPQTIESIAHAKEAGIPIIVAVNKMDKTGANPDHVKGQLSEHGVTPEDWGGDTPVIPVSAHTGMGIEDLLDMILLVSEMKELKANPDRDGVGTVIESHLDLKFGPVATILINSGTINSGDNIVCRDAYGKVKVMKNYKSKNIKKAIPGDPILIVGLSKVVEGGDILQVVSSSSLAREKSIEFSEIMARKKSLSATGLELLMSKIKAGNLKQLKLVVKADTNGSLEAIKNSLLKLSTKETSVNVIHSGVGSITEGDILMCQGSEAILIGFGVDVLNTAVGVLDSSGVEFLNSKIIYHITEKIEKIVTGMLDPKEVEVVLSRAKCAGIFYTSKEFMVVGLRIVEDEKVLPNTKIRVFRKNKYIGKGNVKSVKRGVEEVKMVEGPAECGIKFSGNVVIEEGDIIEIYKVEISK